MTINARDSGADAYFQPVTDLGGQGRLRHMRAALFAMILLCGCGDADDSTTTGTVLSYRGDPDNFTSSGFPRHIYSVQNCGYQIKLKPPFQVSEDGWGNPEIRVPLGLLDDASIKTVAEDGIEAQLRVSYAFPSMYRGEGMREWFTTGLTGRPIVPSRALSTAESTLGTNETMIGDGTRGETRYLGKLADGRETALLCTATDLPNPTCKAELPIGSSGQRFLIIFPPKAIGKLTRMVEIGDELFSDLSARCKPQ